MQMAAMYENHKFFQRGEKVHWNNGRDHRICNFFFFKQRNGRWKLITMKSNVDGSIIYQTEHFLTGFIGEPTGHPNSEANSGVFARGPITLKKKK